MTFSDTAMMELGITLSTNIHNTGSLIRTLKYVLDIQQTEEAFTVEKYKHTHTHTHTHVLNSRSYKFCKTHRNAPAPKFLFNLQPSTLSKKRRRYRQRSVSFVDFFRNTFILENLLQTGFERRILRKMTDRNNKRHYNKEIS